MKVLKIDMSDKDIKKQEIQISLNRIEFKEIAKLVLDKKLEKEDDFSLKWQMRCLYETVKDYGIKTDFIVNIHELYIKELNHHDRKKE